MGADLGLIGSELESQIATQQVETPEPEPEPVEQPVEAPVEEPPQESEIPEEEAPEGEAPRPSSAPKEVLPQELAKSLREFREAHPEHAKAVRKIQNDFYGMRQVTNEFPGGIDEIRTVKSTLDALGGSEGISRMRAEIQASRELDSLAQEGDPRAIHSLADEYPEGFKRLVPAALERLQNMDRQTYADTLRGPILQSLEGDGVIQTLGAAIEELKAGNADRASRELDRIAAWYRDIKQKETDFRNRWQDPRLQDLQKREQSVRQQQADMMLQHARREVSAYLSQSLDPVVRQLTQGSRLSADGIADLKRSITYEVWDNLGKNDFYMKETAALLKQGDLDRVISFAKPQIDQARKAVAPKVWARRYGAPAQQRRPAPGASTQPNGQSNGQNPANRPMAQQTMPAVPIQKAPPGEEIDWNADPTRVHYIKGEARLKNGKFVRWKVGG